MLNVSVPWMKMCVCLMALFPSMCAYVWAAGKENSCVIGWVLLCSSCCLSLSNSLFNNKTISTVLYVLIHLRISVILMHVHVSECAWCMHSHAKYAHTYRRIIEIEKLCLCQSCHQVTGWVFTLSIKARWNEQGTVIVVHVCACVCLCFTQEWGQKCSHAAR